VLPKLHDSSIVMEEGMLDRVLGHSSHEVRSLALSLLISSPSTTRPYTVTALRLLEKHLSAYFADFDAKFRTDTLSKSRDMFKRIRGAIFVLERSLLRAKAATKTAKVKSNGTKGPDNQKAALYKSNILQLSETELQPSLDEHEQFLHWYLDFLRGELLPTASYQRHASALKALIILLKLESDQSKNWETPRDGVIFYDKFDTTWVRCLLDLIMDPFEEIRSASALVLNYFFSDRRFRRLLEGELPDLSRTPDVLRHFLLRASKLASRTGRADKADGVARGYELLYRYLETAEQRLSLLTDLVDSLEAKIVLAEQDLGRAVIEAPLHGYLASLR
jgi:hypothetical protein